MYGALPVIALAIVNSLTADPMLSKIRSSLPLASAMNHPSANLGAVSVLFVSVSVHVGVTMSVQLRSQLQLEIIACHEAQAVFGRVMLNVVAILAGALNLTNEVPLSVSSYILIVHW